ncbi:MAG: peptidoglycan-binding protein [Acidobacteria bacterium]|nr:peptidoglycan-binding protein [Acidobacteriota bacterium]
MAYSQATIKILDKDAIDDSIGLTEFIKVQFNPTEYSIEKSAQIAEIAIPGIDSPILQFIRGQNEKLTLELFFDTTGGGRGDDTGGMGDGAKDVRDKTRSIYQLVKIQPKTHAPPRIQFTWGSLSFRAIVESVQQKFTLFSPSGIPLRATVTVSFREYKTLEEQLKELKLQSSDHTKQRVIQQGDTLNHIAFEEYDNPSEWRRIVEANPRAIVNPRRLIPGIALEIPPTDVFGSKIVKRR